MPSPEIHTYHHISPCASLLLATTTPLNALPHRAPPSLDASLILPLPPLPHSPSPSSDNEDDPEDENNNKDSSNNQSPSPKDLEKGVKGKGKGKENSEGGEGEDGDGDKHYAVLLSTTLDKKPQIIRRDDGFERRRLVRCAKCRGCVGYFLEHPQQSGQHQQQRVQPSTSSTNITTIVEAEEEGEEEPSAQTQTQNKEKEKEKQRVVYIIPGGLVETTELDSYVGLAEGEAEIWDRHPAVVAADVGVDS
ncbi:MAG: hypothetical protein M1834_000054 [Cirrosporium novae-zelandiae]|nr:MAG: hypothetical protein M1834_000054 [Cirrosporium novae-zelandiae]